MCVCHKFREEKDQRILDTCDGSGNGSGTELGNAGSAQPDLEVQIIARFRALAPSSFLFLLFQYYNNSSMFLCFIVGEVKVQGRVNKGQEQGNQLTSDHQGVLNYPPLQT